MNKGTKILNKMLANPIQQSTEKIIQLNQVEFFSPKNARMVQYLQINVIYHLKME